MRCEEVLGALAAGETGAALDAHVAGCVTCAAAVRGAGGGAQGPTVPVPMMPASPVVVPTVAAFRARERRERVVRGGLLAAAVVVLAVGASRLGSGAAPGGLSEEGAGVAAHDSRPPIAAAEGPWDVRTGMDDLVDPDPLGDLADPTDLFDVAPSGEGSL